ncbi:APC family permease [Mesoterricola silvestris]|uniref:Amino acid transporter n=1 Tax=Mesoterricola silvestris TaxID=2927979 RepID=A0AA48GJX6_9BACT|nr:amino acid permease [Mesoterricola silvestris]BDU72549.1 amino acid transporter [Mesoterricola silvestris]
MGPNSPRRELGLLDVTCLIVGIIVGTGIYQVAPDVARGAGGPWRLLGLWALGGALSLCGALGYAELASAYPREGGDYVYLTRAYGSRAGFLFGWLQLAVARPGDIAILAFAFATYARAIWDPWPGGGPALRVYALAAVAGLTAIHMVGVRASRWTQNLLTAVKFLGLLAIALAACLKDARPPVAGPQAPLPLSVALILVLFTYGGWNEMAYVAAEVRQPGRNLIRAMVLGTGAVTGLYLAVTLAFLHLLGFQGLSASRAVASEAFGQVLPALAGKALSALICLSALGALGGIIFTGARISYAVGRDHPAFRPLAAWDGAAGAPRRALLIQGLVAAGLVVALGALVDALVYTAAAVYLFYLATSLAVFVLRRRDPQVPRPYRVTAYPLPTLVFCAVCLFLIHGAVAYRPRTAAAAFGVLALGLPIHAFGRPRPAQEG